MPSGIERVAIILSLGKLGIVFFPLDPVLSKEEVQHILSLTSAELIVVGQDNNYMSLWNRYELKAKVCNLDSLNDKLSIDCEQVILQEVVVQSDMFCIIFTSGSTGISKGVMLTHGNFINRFTCIGMIFRTIMQMFFVQNQTFFTITTF